MRRDDMIFFWKVTEKYGFLSNWYLANFEIDGVKYNCTEQYMMYQKALLFNDLETAEQILNATDQRTQKNLGRQVKNFNINIWNENAHRIVFEGNFAKFSQNKNLLLKLIKTFDKELVEASPYDAIWGIGMTAEDPSAADPNKWMGTNWLGGVLMDVRKKVIIPVQVDNLGFDNTIILDILNTKLEENPDSLIAELLAEDEIHFDISIGNTSHVIKHLSEKDGNIIADIKILNSPKGINLINLIEKTNLITFKPRIAGIIKNNEFIIEDILTIDAVIKPAKSKNIK